MAYVVLWAACGVAAEPVDACAAGGAPFGRGGPAVSGHAPPGGDRAAGRGQPRLGDAVEAAARPGRPPWPVAPRLPRAAVAPGPRPVVAAAAAPAGERGSERVRDGALGAAARRHGGRARVRGAVPPALAGAGAAGAGLESADSPCPRPLAGHARAHERDNAVAEAWLTCDWPRLNKGLAVPGGPSSSSTRPATRASRGWAPRGRPSAARPSCAG
jgi:hypothetical protein